jgi:hypothetical protein
MDHLSDNPQYIMGQECMIEVTSEDFIAMSRIISLSLSFHESCH